MCGCVGVRVCQCEYTLFCVQGQSCVLNNLHCSESISHLCAHVCACVCAYVCVCVVHMCVVCGST